MSASHTSGTVLGWALLELVSYPTVWVKQVTCEGILEAKVEIEWEEAREEHRESSRRPWETLGSNYAGKVGSCGLFLEFRLHGWGNKYIIYHTSFGTAESWSGDFNSKTAYKRPQQRKGCSHNRPLALQYSLDIVRLCHSLRQWRQPCWQKHLINQPNKQTRSGACTV